MDVQSGVIITYVAIKDKHPQSLAYRAELKNGKEKSLKTNPSDLDGLSNLEDDSSLYTDGRKTSTLALILTRVL